MSVASVTEVGEVLSEHAVDQPEAVKPEGVAEDEVLNGIPLLFSYTHRYLTVTVVSTSATIDLTMEEAHLRRGKVLYTRIT